MNNQSRKPEAQFTLTQFVNGRANVNVKKPPEKDKMGNFNSLPLLKSVRKPQTVNGVHRDTTPVTKHGSGFVENRPRQQQMKSDSFYRKRKSSESVVFLSPDEKKERSTSAALKNSCRNYSNPNKRQNGAINSLFTNTVQVYKPVKQKSPATTANVPKQRQLRQSCDRNMTNVKTTAQRPAVNDENRRSQARHQTSTVTGTNRNDSEFFLTSAYSEPLSINEIFYGNIVKAQNRGKLCRGKIIEIDFPLKRCLIKFNEFTESWILNRDIFPSSPMKSQVLKRVIERNKSRVPDSPPLHNTHARTLFPTVSPKEARVAEAADDITLQMEVDESECDSQMSGPVTRMTSPVKVVSSSTRAAIKPMSVSATKSSPTSSVTSDDDVMHIVVIDDDGAEDVTVKAKASVLQRVRVTKQQQQQQTLGSKAMQVVSSTSRGSTAPSVRAPAVDTVSPTARAPADQAPAADDDAAALNDDQCSLLAPSDQSFTDHDLYCELCMGGESDYPNEIVICDQCAKGFHQMCHKPNIPNWVIENEAAEWLCSSCTVTHGAAAQRRKKTLPQEFRPREPFTGPLPTCVSQLPYDPLRLTWTTSQQLENRENRYCYCGSDGKWYLQMLQCRNCRQWFHQECVSCLHAPMMYGDRFYAFLCSLCNAPTDAGRGAVGNEFMLRLHMRWVDFIHLATFHLGMLLGKTYIDIHDDLVPFLDENCEMLQVPKEITDYDAGQVHFKIENIINKECASGRFRPPGKKQPESCYALTSRCPPEPPLINLPDYRPLTNENTYTFAWKHAFRRFQLANHKAVDWPYSRPALGRSLTLGQLPCKTALYQSSGKRRMVMEDYGEFDDEQQPPSKKRKKMAAGGAAGDAFSFKKKAQKKELIFVKGNSHKTVRVTSYPPVRYAPAYCRSPQKQRARTHAQRVGDGSDLDDEEAFYDDMRASFKARRRRGGRAKNDLNSLNRLIPPPDDFEDDRNPFLYEVERQDLRNLNRYRQYALYKFTKGNILLDDMSGEVNHFTLASNLPTSDGGAASTSGGNGSGSSAAPVGPPAINPGRNSGDVSTSKIIKGKRKREKDVRLEPKLPDGFPPFRYEPYIVIGKRRTAAAATAAAAETDVKTSDIKSSGSVDAKSEYVFIWDPVL